MTICLEDFCTQSCIIQGWNYIIDEDSEQQCNLGLTIGSTIRYGPYHMDHILRLNFITIYRTVTSDSLATDIIKKHLLISDRNHQIENF